MSQSGNWNGEKVTASQLRIFSVATFNQSSDVLPADPNICIPG